jgi:uncharacterized repeat protein (TIGR01451 family)
MKSVISRNNLKVYIVAFSALTLLLTGVFITVTAPNAQAVIIEGNPGSGSAGGGGTGYATGNGHGWALFDVAGAGPNEFKDGSKWADVAKKCSDASSNKVWAYIIRNGSGGQKVFTYKNYFNRYGYTNYNDPSNRPWIDEVYPSTKTNPYVYNKAGDHDGVKRWYSPQDSPNGFPSLVISTVRDKYTAAGGSEAKWGHNVGWFCWSDNPPWTISVTSSVDKTIIEPGETVTWTHTVTNDGANTTNAEIISNYKNTGTDWSAGTGGNWKWPSGKVKGSTNPQKSPSYTAQFADYGKTFCRTTTASPKSNKDTGVIESAQACVTVGRKPKVQVHSGDLSVGKVFSGTSTASVVNTAISRTPQVVGVIPTYNPNLITGLYGTGVAANGTPIDVDNQAVTDPHWRVSDISAGTAGAEPCQGSPGSAYAIVKTTYQGKASPRGTNSNIAWKLNPAGVGGAWIGANPLASTSYYKENNPSAKCKYPGNFTLTSYKTQTYNNTKYQSAKAAFTALAPVWTFKMSDFTVSNSGSCTIDLDSIQLRVNMSADDEAEIYVNDILVASKSDNPNAGNAANTTGLKDFAKWPASLVTVTTRKVAGAYRVGANTLTIKVKSASSATGLIVGGGMTSTATCQDPGAPKVFGSWVEYGIFATGTITGTASGSGLAGAAGQAASDECTRARLSFAASTAVCAPLTTAIGNYTPSRLIPDISALFPQVGSTISIGTIVPDSLLSAAGTYVGTRTGNLTLDTSNLQPGKSVILKVTGTVTIAGNQINNVDNNGAKYQSIGQLPQLVIIADKIIINSGVVNVDAWLVANGANGIVETCDTGSATYALTGAAKLSDKECDKQLTINGPIMAKHLWLRRTFGTLTGDLGTPAEIINLRPDAYLWARAQVGSQGRLQTVYTTELPPRL